MIQSRSCRFSKPVVWCALVFLGQVSSGRAMELGENLQMHGFVSQALVHTSDNRVGGGSDDGVGADMREMGVNMSWRPNPDWLLSAQVLSRWAGATDDGTPGLDYGFVDYAAFNDGLTRMGVRLGKVKNPLGFYNTTRDVAHTRPGVIMPQSMYLDRVRDFYLAAPGVSLYGLHALENTEVAWTLNYMRPEADDVDLEYLFLLNDWSGRFEGRPSWIGQIMLDQDGGQWRLGLTLGDVGVKYQRGGSLDPVQAGRSNLSTWALSAQANLEDWSLTGEYSRTRNEGSGFGPLLAGVEDPNTVEGWYLQATWRPREDWHVYLRRDVFYLDKDDRDGSRFQAQSGAPAHLIYGRGWTAGLRRDLGNWSFWGEWARTTGTVWLSPQEGALSSQKKDWDMLLLQAAWRF